MIIKKMLFIVFISSIMILFLIGCGSGNKNDNKIVVGTMPLTVGVPVQYAYEKGFYEEEGLDVEIIIFSTGAPINEAFSAKQLDIAVSGLASVYSLANANAKWVGEINTTGGLGVYVRPDSEILSVQGQAPDSDKIYGSAELLKGIQVLGPLGTTAQFNLLGWAEQFGLDSTDVMQVHMEYGAAYTAFEAGEADAIALNPPFSFQAENEGYILVAPFEDATGASLVDGIFISEEFESNRKEDLVKFLRATYRACDELQDIETRLEFSHEWFNANGKEYDEKILMDEINVRDYITAEMMTQSDYIYGLGMYEIAQFYVNEGTIEENNLESVLSSFKPEYIEEALDIDIKVYK